MRTERYRTGGEIELRAAFTPAEAAHLRALLSSLTKSDAHAALQRIAPAKLSKGTLNFKRVPHKLTKAVMETAHELAIHLRELDAPDVFAEVPAVRRGGSSKRK